MYKQIIVARKDLNMSAGKLAAQVSHASMAFLTNSIKKNMEENDSIYLKSTIYLEKELFTEWINGAFTKCVLEAKNKNHLLKIVDKATELGLKENVDFYLIRDNCLTELTPEDADGRTLTCIGFKPMDAKKIDLITKRYQLYK